MNIHEYQAKQILKQFGIKVPEGRLATGTEEAEVLIGSFTTFPVVVKAQIHAGGRGQAGGVKLTKSAEEAMEAVKSMLGKTLVTKQTGPAGKVVNKVYLEAGTKIEKEYYISAVVDRSSCCIAYAVSASGGMEIEEVAAKDPNSVLTIPVDVVSGLQGFHIRKASFFLGLGKEDTKELAAIMLGIYRTFLATDANQIEINPLIKNGDGAFMALDAKINFDDNAAYRHPNIQSLRDESEEDPAENEAARHSLNYVRMDGAIGCMVNGAGLAMATMDIIKYHGGEPANFLDVGGGADETRVQKAFEIILGDKSVKAIIVNIFGGIVKCDLIAQGIIEATKAINVTIPLVVRLSGTNFDKGKELLQNSGLSIIVADDLNEAALKVVQAVEGSK